MLAVLAEITLAVFSGCHVTSHVMPAHIIQHFPAKLPKKKKLYHVHSWPWEFEKPVYCLLAKLLCYHCLCVCVNVNICSCGLSDVLVCTLVCDQSEHAHKLCSRFVEWTECHKIRLHVCVIYIFLSLECVLSKEVQICLFRIVCMSFSRMTYTKWMCGCLFAKAQPGFQFSHTRWHQQIPVTPEYIRSLPDVLTSDLILTFFEKVSAHFAKRCCLSCNLFERINLSFQNNIFSAVCLFLFYTVQFDGVDKSRMSPTKDGKTRPLQRHSSGCLVNTKMTSLDHSNSSLGERIDPTMPLESQLWVWFWRFFFTLHFVLSLIQAFILICPF